QFIELCPVDAFELFVAAALVRHLELHLFAGRKVDGVWRAAVVGLRDLDDATVGVVATAGGDKGERKRGCAKDDCKARHGANPGRRSWNRRLRRRALAAVSSGPTG